MFSTPQAPLQAGLAPSIGSAMQISGPTSSQCSSSQMPTVSSNIFSHAEEELQPSPILSEATDSRSIDDLFKSIFGVEPTTSLFDLRMPKTMLEDIATCYNEQDFSPVLHASPPASSRTSFWYRDALDRAGERVEKFLYPTFKALLMALQVKSEEAESHERMIKDAILMVSQALHEARKCRIEGRFGFRAAEKMDSEPSGGLLTQRQAQILEELSKEQKKQQGPAYIYASSKSSSFQKYNPRPPTTRGKQFFQGRPRSSMFRSTGARRDYWKRSSSGRTAGMQKN
ncbi:uncharacterized protein MONOS_8465 [Monocercomonoides exilis]|uniref:uncharacterized protein n=1 Tax=Monocercomonoides exilis TaxID=2049356 RepID=UPI003559D284|nr:hypothetical protein MONOS_8465 [Monocercomonoides exilis]|eukprot:MONOS_8465.1-p1 / transcript=MONOS_8465.1 / gene=MONOS_8465 / organism=Monocercomonoides_exilis_PA203 / gene_product=unspecified product / transcript_product=unspecified product / location=Mono_scaffold00320:10392-11246(+) / protein_length=285 / sequence_SO=supercontig / SO=protein_coding / is_pseudo=false